MTRHQLFNAAIPAAGTSATAPIKRLGDAAYLACQVNFDRVSGGTTLDLYIQTSLDNGTTWIDIMQFSLATTDARLISSVKAVSDLTPITVPTDGTLTANTIKDGVIGDQVRLKYIVVGTYVGTLAVNLEAK